MDATISVESYNSSTTIVPNQNLLRFNFSPQR
jgi:hypothetical protein